MGARISKKKEEVSQPKRLKRLIGVDQPFDYEEVVAVTGAEYVRNLDRNGVSFMPYEEVKRRVPGLYLVDNECVWMRAGVISFHLCEIDYDCDHCIFDSSMRAAMAGEPPPKYNAKSSAWEDDMLDRYESVMDRCIHFLAGQKGIPEACSEDHECFRCPVHHSLTYYQKEEPKALSEFKSKVAYGFRVADGYYYHYGHSWMHVIHGGYVRVGIDDFMAKLFGRAVQVRLPPEGISVKQGSVASVLTRNGNTAPVRSPLSGKVLAVNHRVLERPEIIHDDPYEKGWLYHLEPSFLRREYQGLYSGREALQWVERENQSLLKMLGSEYERLAATGAETVDDIFGTVPGIKWDNLVRTFLHTIEKS